MNNVILSKNINRIFKKYFSYFNAVIFLIFLALLFFSIEVVTSYFNNSFVIDVEERGGKLVGYAVQNYSVAERKVHSLLQFKSNKILDYIFVKKTSDYYLPEVLFTLFVLIQIFKINGNWYGKKFTKQLYNLIDVLGFVAAFMYVFSRIQQWYLEKVVEELTNGKLILEDNDYLNRLAIAIMILSIGLKSFAKQGNKLQEEQDLTI